MKRFWKIVSIALICGALATPQIDARGRNNARTESRSSSAARPGSNNKSSRPSGNKVNNNNAPKPGNNNNNNRPGNSNYAPKPGNNNNYRPGNGNNNGNVKPQKPSGTIGNNHQVGQPPRGNNRPAPRPENNHAVRPPKAPAHHVERPHCPPPRPYYRPTPPPAFRPHNGCPVLRSVFGITFGTAINISLDYLYRNSYDVQSYGNDVVYLRNVNQYGYMWHDATLYYGSNGLTGTQLMFSTSYNSRSRYDNVYNTLYNQYGAPVSVQNSSNGIVATWWGYDNQYISLEYRPIYTNNGQLRYFTTLSFGV